VTVDAAQRRGRGGQERLRQAALQLFSQHGVSGTSLQMIADALGVTKAAVYHRCRSKDDIVLAVVGPVLDDLAATLDAAAVRATRAEQVDVVLTRLVDSLLRHRCGYGILLGDPAVGRLLASHPRAQALVQQLDDLLLGPDPDPATRVAVSFVLSGLRGVALGPTGAQLDDETLREHLVDVVRRALAVTGPGSPPA
jgi:AcrR family transcriptional regulator